MFEARDFSEELRCTICLDAMRDAVELRPCGHHFCRSCINSLPTHHNPSHHSVSQCPQCRSNIHAVTEANRIIRNLLDDIPVVCTQCHWRGTRQTIATHHHDIDHQPCRVAVVDNNGSSSPRTPHAADSVVHCTSSCSAWRVTTPPSAPPCIPWLEALPAPISDPSPATLTGPFPSTTASTMLSFAEHVAAMSRDAATPCDAHRVASTILRHMAATTRPQLRGAHAACCRDALVRVAPLATTRESAVRVASAMYHMTRVEATTAVLFQTIPCRDALLESLLPHAILPRSNVEDHQGRGALFIAGTLYNLARRGAYHELLETTAVRDALVALAPLCLKSSATTKTGGSAAATIDDMAGACWITGVLFHVAKHDAGRALLSTSSVRDVLVLLAPLVVAPSMQGVRCLAGTLFLLTFFEDDESRRTSPSCFTTVSVRDTLVLLAHVAAASDAISFVCGAFFNVTHAAVTLRGGSVQDENVFLDPTVRDALIVLAPKASRIATGRSGSASSWVAGAFFNITSASPKDRSLAVFRTEQVRKALGQLLVPSLPSDGALFVQSTIENLDEPPHPPPNTLHYITGSCTVM